MLNKLVIVLLIVLLSSVVYAGHLEWYATTDCYEKSRPNIEHCQQKYEELRKAHYDTCVNPSSSDCHQYCQQFIDEHRWKCEQKCRDELSLAYFRYMECLEGKENPYTGVYDYDEDYDLHEEVSINDKQIYDVQTLTSEGWKCYDGSTGKDKPLNDCNPPPLDDTLVVDEDVIQETNEVSGTVKSTQGKVEILRDGSVSLVTTDLEFYTGDVIHTGEEGGMEIITEDGMVKLGKDTTVEFVGLKFDPVPDGKIKPPPEAPWAPDPGSFKYEIDNGAFWKGVADDMKKHVPTVLDACIASIAGVPNPVNPDIPIPITGIDCLRKPILLLVDGSLWTETKPKAKYPPNFTRESIMTRNILINHMSTEFTVEVADDGTTTVTTLDGSVLVTNLVSRKSVMVGANDQLTVTSGGLGEQELQQSLTKIDPDSIDRWWIQYTDNLKNVMLLVFSILFLIIAAIVGMTALIIKKRAKTETTAWGITSLVFGIISILVFLAPYFGLPLSIGAIWFSMIQKKHKLTKIAITGLVLGIIGTILNVLLALVYIVM